jgi:hypothetical protein
MIRSIRLIHGRLRAYHDPLRPEVASMRHGLRLALFLAFVSPVLSGEDLADAVARARVIVARHLTDVKLNSVYGTPAFNTTGQRIDDVFLNFCGKDAAGNPMLMSLTLTPAEALEGEGNEDNPRPDTYGHHLRPGIALEAWLPPEEAVLIALAQHAGHEPATGGVSLAYRSDRASGRMIMVFYWRRDQLVHDVVIDARFGEIVSVGHTPWPESSS